VSAQLSELRCVAPLGVAVGRVTHRLAAGTDVSDATEEVTRHHAASDVPWLEATDVHTEGQAGEAIAAALAIVGVDACDHTND
jgi:predicted kinase